MCSSLKFTPVVSHLSLVLLLCFELIFSWYGATFDCFVILKFFVVSYYDQVRSALKVANYLKFQNYVGVYQVKISSKHKTLKMARY